MMLRFSFFVFLPYLIVVKALDFHIKNTGQAEIWIGTQPSKNETSSQQLLESGGFKLSAGEEKVVSAPEKWSGLFWARTGCNEGTKTCETANCGNAGIQCNGVGGERPRTLAEITGGTNTDGLDFYDVSLVDGFNIKAVMKPIGGQGECKESSCTENLNARCPEPLQFKNANGDVVGCKSACEVYDTDEYCCRGKYAVSGTCNDSIWKDPHLVKVFKEACPAAYSYAYDDPSSSYTCKNTNGYIIQFG